MRNEYPVFVDKEDYRDNYNFSGLSQYSIDLFHALQYKKDVGKTFSVWNYPPGQFKKSGKINIGYADYEVTKMPAAWVSNCNAMDEIWTSSEFCKSTFIENGVKRDVKVIPHTLNPQLWHSHKEPTNISNKRGFCFLFVSEWMPRKGIYDMLRAWFTAFSHKDDVCLILKTYLGAHGNLNVIRDDINKIRNEEFNLTKDRCAPILLYSDFIKEDVMPNFFKNADVLLAPSLGEGFGLCVAQAQMMGIPAIATNWSSLSEICNDDIGYMIDIDGLEDVSQRQIELIPAYKDAQWAKLNLDSLVDTMKHVYNNSHELKDKSQKCMDFAKSFSYDNVSKLLIESINSAMPKNSRYKHSIFFNPEDGSLCDNGSICGRVSAKVWKQITDSSFVDFFSNKKYCKIYYNTEDANNYGWVEVS